MELNTKSSVPVSVPFNLTNDEIQLKGNVIEDIRKQVIAGTIVVLKKVFPERTMNAFRNEILKWGRENTLFPHGESPNKYPELNYHRIDDGSVPSVCPHLFHQYGFNDISKLAGHVNIFSEVAIRMLLVQNAIADTNFDISLDGLRLKVLQYPEGGGFLAEHTHPRDPQKIGLILSISKRQPDFESGAAVFKTPQGYVDTFEFHDIGDIVLFRYDLPHSVTQVNPKKGTINWSLETGKWSAVLEFRDTHGLSHKK